MHALSTWRCATSDFKNSIYQTLSKFQILSKAMQVYACQWWGNLNIHSVLSISVKMEKEKKNMMRPHGQLFLDPVF